MVGMPGQRPSTVNAVTLPPLPGLQGVVWCRQPVCRSVIVTGNPSGEGSLQKEFDQTMEDTTHQVVWKLYGFKPPNSTFSDNSSNWITTDWQFN
jgi:hypothetical protein